MSETSAVPAPPSTCTKALARGADHSGAVSSTPTGFAPLGSACANDRPRAATTKTPSASVVAANVARPRWTATPTPRTSSLSSAPKLSARFCSVEASGLGAGAAPWSSGTRPATRNPSGAPQPS
ncbi:MAG: hypothetical protein FJ137_21305 [Deltaproteobacteria bacterium]|nr:hypothetical protein [Deltaproteobacteria bacterium]